MPDRAIAPLEELARRILDECGAEWKDVSTVEWTAKVIAAQLRLERAAALQRKAAAIRAVIDEHRKQAGPHENCEEFGCYDIELLAEDVERISDSDRSTLDAYYKAAYDSGYIAGTDSVLSKQDTQNVQERVDRAVLAESEWWDIYIDEHIEKYGKEWRRERGKARLAANRAKVREEK